MIKKKTLSFIKKVLYLFKDPRFFQLFFLGSFLTYGIFALGWYAEVSKYFIVFSFAILIQSIGIWVIGLPVSSIRSALITSLGLCLLLKSSELWVLALASILAISSKFLIRIGNKHIFNPANFGIIATILLTGRSWISPGQWGSDIILLLFFGAAGFMILLRISRLETGITFFITYFLLLVGWNVWYLGWEFNVVIHKITNGSLLLFTFFMITDPMTIPNGKKARIIWAILIAITSFGATVYFQVYTAPIWVLFFYTPVTVLFDKVWPEIKFQWMPNNDKEMNELKHTQPLNN
jgi:Na+-transporting NADH:ubiquinone oxidoreductase subunit NqrB